MYYSETKVIMGGLTHVPILIFILNLIRGKFEAIAAKGVEVKAEELIASEVQGETEVWQEKLKKKGFVLIYLDRFVN